MARGISYAHIGKVKIMAKNKTFDLNLKSPEEPVEKLYSIWKKNKLDTGNYTVISNSLKEYLKFIRTPALNLYMMYVIAADSKTGESYYSIETLSKELGVSNKTIDNWNNILIDLGLIVRQQTFNSSARTFLLPMSDMIFLSKEEETFESYKELIDTEGFQESNIINLVELDKKSEYIRYTCHQYTRKYTHQYAKATKRRQAEIERNYFIVKKESTFNEKKNYENFTESKDWGIEEDEFTIFFNKNEISSGNGKKEERKNLDKLLLQLTSEENIRMYKEKFQRIDI